MNEGSEDLFFEVIDEYENGHILEAMQRILITPDVQYESLPSLQPLFKYLVNYVDACVFKNILSVQHTNLVLRGVISSDINLAPLATQFIEILNWEEKFLYLYAFEEKVVEETIPFNKTLQEAINILKVQEDITDLDIENFLNLVPPFYHPFIEQKLQIFKAWKDLKKNKSQFCQIIEIKEPIQVQQPWHVFSYHLPINSLPNVAIELTPLIFLEPIEGADYNEILAPYVNRKVICVFETIQHLLQMLQYRSFVLFLKNPEHHIYILELYPHDQIISQNILKSHLGRLEPIFLIENSTLFSVMPLFIEVFTKCLNQKEEELESDTPIANWLYQISKRALFNRQAKRYGKDRFIALNMEETHQKSTDLHKGLPPPQSNLGPLPKDELNEHVNLLLAERQARAFAPEKKIRLAHIVPQVVSSGGAPTRQLVNLLRYGDKNWFDLYLLSTERFSTHIFEYPISTTVSAPSNVESFKILSYLDSLEIKIHVEPTPPTYEQAAQHIAKVLKDFKMDVAVFHGPDEVNTLCAAMTDTPIRILLDHGILPKYPVFDFAILSTEQIYMENHDKLKKMGMDSCYLPYWIDVMQHWEKDIYSKEELGFPADSFIMTTISNRLDVGLSEEMCQAIGEILRRNPKAYYAPIGVVNDPERIRSLFRSYGVDDRVVLLGDKANPSQYARSMELYLNEFPAVSGLGMLDAIAAGCPVVSMYDEHGPEESKYAGAYFGMDHVIVSCKKEDYIELACKLIVDQDLYKEWSNYAKGRYARYADANNYVLKFEKVLNVFIDYWQEKMLSEKK